MINVLVTGVGGNIGQGIMKAIRMSGLRTRMIATDMNPFSAGLFRCERGYIVKSCKDKGFLNQILKIIDHERVRIVFVGSDVELSFFSENKTRIEAATGTQVIVSPPEVARSGYDKWQTFLFCRKKKIPYPQTFLAKDKTGIRRLISEKGFPVIVKPRIGYGSRGVETVRNFKELEVFLRRTANPIIQESLGSPDQEYTGSSFMLPDRRIVGTIIFHRYLAAGATYKAEVIQNYQLTRQIEKIVHKISPLGPCNIQFRLVKNKVTPFEFNIRFSGTTPIRSALGFNDVEMALRYFVLGEKLKRPRIKPGVALRYWNELILPGRDFKELLRKRFMEREEANTLDYF